MGNLKTKPALRKAVTGGDLSAASLGESWASLAQEKGAAAAAEAAEFLARTSKDLDIDWSKEELAALMKLATGDDAKFRIGNLQIRLRRLERKLRTESIPFSLITAAEDNYLCMRTVNDRPVYIKQMLTAPTKESYLSLLPREILEQLASLEDESSIAGTTLPIAKKWSTALPATYDARHALWTDHAVTFVSRENAKAPSYIDALSLRTGTRLWRSQPIKPAPADKRTPMCSTKSGALLCAGKKLHVYTPPLLYGMHVSGLDPAHAARVIGLAAIEDRVLALTEPSADGWPKHLYSLDLCEGEYVATKVVELPAHDSPETNVSTSFLRAGRTPAHGDMAAIYTGDHLYVVFVATNTVKEVACKFLDCNRGQMRGFAFLGAVEKLAFGIANQVLFYALADLSKSAGQYNLTTSGGVLSWSLSCAPLGDFMHGAVWSNKSAETFLVPMDEKRRSESVHCTFDFTPAQFKAPQACPEAHLAAYRGRKKDKLLLCATDGTLAWFSIEPPGWQNGRLLRTFKYEHACSATASCVPQLRMCGDCMIYTCPKGIACFAVTV